MLIISDYEQYGWIHDPDFIVNEIRFSLEYILFDEALVEISDSRSYRNILNKLGYTFSNYKVK